MATLSTPREVARLSPAIPINNSIFEQHGLKLRRGQFSILAAAPGVGKSLVATNLALHASVPALYFSADSDEWTVRQRAIGALSGYELTKVEEWLNGAEADKLNEYLLRADHVDWCFNAELDADYIVRRIQAHEEIWGDFPALTVVDNISDLVQDENNEFAELRGLCRQLRKMARRTDSHIMALHHVNGALENGDKPVNLGDLQGKLGKVPEMVLGLSRQWIGNSQSLLLTVPKNRGGKQGLNITLPVDYTRATIGGFNRG